MDLDAEKVIAHSGTSRLAFIWGKYTGKNHTETLICEGSAYTEGWCRLGSTDRFPLSPLLLFLLAPSSLSFFFVSNLSYYYLNIY